MKKRNSESSNDGNTILGRIRCDSCSFLTSGDIDRCRMCNKSLIKPLIELDNSADLSGDDVSLIQASNNPAEAAVIEVLDNGSNVSTNRRRRRLEETTSSSSGDDLTTSSSSRENINNIQNRVISIDSLSPSPVRGRLASPTTIDGWAEFIASVPYRTTRSGRGREGTPPRIARVGGGRTIRVQHRIRPPGRGAMFRTYNENIIDAVLAESLYDYNGPTIADLGYNMRSRVGGGWQNAGLVMGGNHLDVDRMSYDELLQMFGNGNEAKPATVEVITSLPVHSYQSSKQKDLILIDVDGDADGSDTVNKNELPSCCICMEEFENGDKLKSLPCLHQFHDSCIDQWLLNSAICPICKYKL